MKELSIEEKAKRYDEALEKAHKLCAYPTTKPFISDLQDLFPELKESEDEKIRKALILHYQGDGCLCTNEYRIDYKDICAWIEKQGEQRPDWSEEDNKMLSFIGNAITADDASIYLKSKGIQIIDVHIWLEELKKRVLPQPKQEWSEEDENRVNRLIAYFEDKESFTAEDDIVYANWLKSLRPQSTWKPSDEQLHYLSWVANIKLGDSVVEQEVSKHLNELLEDLKKLREE